MTLTLKAARINSGFTQKEAGERLGVSQYTIGNWENGRSFPDANQIKKIETLYNLSYDNIVFLDENNALSVKTTNN